MSRWRWGLLAAAALVAFAAGLQVARWWALAPPPSGRADALLEHSFTDLDDGPRQLKRWQGRTVLVNFWATWCAPCRREMPLFQAVQAQYPQDVLQVVGIALDDADAVRRFRDELDIRFPLWLDDGTAASLMAQYGNRAGGLPFSLWLGADGRVLGNKLGAFAESELRAALAEYLPDARSSEK